MDAEETADPDTGKTSDTDIRTTAGLKFRCRHSSGFPCPVHVDDPLVGASAVSESQVALRLYVFSVNQNVDGVQQLSQRFPVFCQPTGAFRTGTGQAGQFLQRVPGIHPDIQAAAFDFLCQSIERSRLTRRFSAAEGDPLKKGVGVHSGEDFVDITVITAGEIMSFGVMAAGAPVRAALAENYKAYSGTVYDGFADNAGEPKSRAHVYSLSKPELRPCLTRSRSSAVLASFQLSMVPTR